MKTSSRGTPEARSPSPTCLLVAVHRGGVDVAIAQTQRLLDHARAAFAAQIPGAETDQWNAGAAGFNDWGLHGWHVTNSCTRRDNAASPRRLPTAQVVALVEAASQFDLRPSTENATSGA